MPRAKKRCAKPDCREFQPCRKHPSGWRANDGKYPLPSNWGALRKAVRRRSGGQCELTLGGVRCSRSASVIDHIIPRSEGGSDDMSNLQHLCSSHHDPKTREEKKRGIRRRFQK